MFVLLFQIHLLSYGIVDSFHVVELDDTTPANNLVGPEVGDG